MKKKFDIYVNRQWERNKEEEKKLYPNELDPMYWHYVDFMEEYLKHPRVINLKVSQSASLHFRVLK